jgi:hypothetical protein
LRVTLCVLPAGAREGGVRGCEDVREGYEERGRERKREREGGRQGGRESNTDTDTGIR